MYNQSEWQEVYWGLVAEVDERFGLDRLEVDVPSLALRFSQRMRELEEEDRQKERLVLYEEKLDRITGEFLNLFFDCPHRATGRDGRAVMWPYVRRKAQEILETIRSRVGEEPGISY